MFDFLKKIIFWSQIREFLIIRKHQKVAKYCHKLIAEYYIKGIHYEFIPKHKFKEDKIIWQYWGQGYTDESMPELVKICLDSVERYKPDDAILVRLSDDNLSKYIDLPDFIITKLKFISKAHFSDILRMVLLTTYGGCWLDATILLTEKIPEHYWSFDYFLFTRDQNEINKDYWKHAYAYYYNWNRTFKVRSLNSIIWSKRNNKVIKVISEVLLYFWETHSNVKLPDYFFWQILYNELVTENYGFNICPIESDCVPHYMQQYLNDDFFNLLTLEQILATTTIHKLSYKNNSSLIKLKKTLKDLEYHI